METLQGYHSSSFFINTTDNLHYAFLFFLQKKWQSRFMKN